MHPGNPDFSSLAKSPSHAVALIVSDITNLFFAEIIPAIEERLGFDGFVVFVGNSSEDGQREERLLAKIREFPPDGILICPALGDVESSFGPPALAGRLPIVAFARRAPGLDYAGIDNAQGAQLAVEHFFQVGYHRIAFVGGNPNSSAVQERVEGYQKALTRSGLQFDPLLVIPSAPTRAGGYDSVRKLITAENLNTPEIQALLAP
jgi:LacI family transcriptional regulator